jgi:hypothetical protein
MIHQPYLNASSSRNDKRYRREEGRVQDVSAGTVGESASRRKALESKWSAHVVKDKAGSIGESARDDDESKAKGSDE